MIESTKFIKEHLIQFIHLSPENWLDFSVIHPNKINITDEDNAKEFTERWNEWNNNQKNDYLYFVYLFSQRQGYKFGIAIGIVIGLIVGAAFRYF